MRDVGPRRRRRWFVTGFVLLALALSALAYDIVAHTANRQAPPAATTSQPSATATIEQRSLSSRTHVNGTLGYAHDDSVVNQLGGYYTKVPQSGMGQVLDQGQELYRVGAVPVVLLNGSIPAWRDLSRGDTGQDVAQLNTDLVALGLLDRSRLVSADAFGSATENAVKALQHRLGATASGILPLGHVVFLPGPIRIVAVNPVAGSRAIPDTVILKATSTERQATCRLAACQVGEVAVVKVATITLDLGGPNQRTVPGTISNIDTTATSGSADTGAAPTFEVDITPHAGAQLGDIDQMPVQIGITTATAHDALVVPVTALLATADQGYAVAVVTPTGARQRIPVKLGIFDDADGLVQITGSGIEPGQRVVVPTL